jgi:CelD/BcsL family acetyltransferase involved in cellulose biosynthesis
VSTAMHVIDDLAPPLLPAAATLPARDVSLAADVVTSAAGLAALEAEWLALEERTSCHTVFQNYATVRTWARHFLRGEGERHRLHVAVVRHRGRAALILPLVISRAGPFRVARMAGDPIAQYSDLLVDPEIDAEAAFEAALQSVRAAGADAIVFRRVREDSALLALAAPHARPGINASSAPYADLSGFADYDSLLQSLSKNMRKGLRNRRHHLDKTGGAAFELLTGGAQARQAVADALNMKRSWLIQRGAVSTAFLDPHTRECLLDLAEDRSGVGAVVLRLSVKGEPAAIRFGFEYQNTYFAYMSAYDPAFAHLAPGKMLMDFYLSAFDKRGLTCIDMLPPSSRHKTDWCDAETKVGDYTLPLTQRGRVYAEVYQERLRPGLQKAWKRLPDWARSAAAAVLVSV